MQRLIHILISLDQLLFSIITLGKAYPNETLSSAAYRGELDRKIMGRLFRPVIDTLLWFDKDHCRQAYYNVLYGKQLPSTYVK